MWRPGELANRLGIAHVPKERRIRVNDRQYCSPSRISNRHSGSPAALHYTADARRLQLAYLGTGE